MPDGGDDHCLVPGSKALEITRRQIGKLYRLAVWPDEKGRYPRGSVTTNQIICSVGRSLDRSRVTATDYWRALQLRTA
jgi:hypothetical protein